MSVKFAETRSPESPPAPSPPGQNGHSSGQNGHASYPPAPPQPYVQMQMPPMPYGMQMMGGYGGAPPPGAGHKLFVGMIPYATGENELQQVLTTTCPFPPPPRGYPFPHAP